MNRHSHIATSTISQSSFFEEVCCLILAFSQMELRGYIELLKFDHDKKNKQIQVHLKFIGLDGFSQNLVSNIT